MNLWLITRIDRGVDYDEYDSAVVAAKTAKEAACIHPSGGLPVGHPERGRFDAWVSNPILVSVELVGEAKRGTKPGVICASFNAG